MKLPSKVIASTRVEFDGNPDGKKSILPPSSTSTTGAQPDFDHSSKPHRRDESEHAKKKKELAREVKSQVIFGLIVTSLLLVISYIVGLTQPGQAIKAFEYEMIQKYFLQSSQVSSGSSIIIIDISDMPVVQSVITSDPSARGTSRTLLTQVIDKLRDDGASAVGVDIDFSPFPGSKTGYALPDDSVFLDHCLAISHGSSFKSSQRAMPVFLGVGREAGYAPNLWLGSAVYSSLAAGIDVPKFDTSRLVYSMPSATGERRLEAMGVQLSKYAPAWSDKELYQCTTALAWGSAAKLVERTGPDEEYPSLFDSFYPDYHSVNDWAAEVEKQGIQGELSSAIRIFSYADILTGRVGTEALRGKVILLGDVSRPDVIDTAHVPGIESTVPGVLLHACTFLSLTNLRLYHMTPFGRIVADIVLALLLIVGSGVLRYYILEKKDNETAGKNFELVLRPLIAIAVIMTATIFTSVSRLVWSDFIYVVIGMYLHPGIHHHIHSRFKRWIKQNGKEATTHE